MRSPNGPWSAASCILCPRLNTANRWGVGGGRERGRARREDSKSCREGTGAGSWPLGKVARARLGLEGRGGWGWLRSKREVGAGSAPPPQPLATGTWGRGRGPHPAGRGGRGRGPGGAGPSAHFLEEGLGPRSHSPTQSVCSRQPSR